MFTIIFLFIYREMALSGPTVVDTLLKQLVSIDTSKIVSNISTKRKLDNLISDIQLLDIAREKYIDLFYFQKSFANKRNRTIKRSENLIKSGAPQANINKARENLQKIFEKYETSRNIFSSNDPIAKEITLKEFIERLRDLRKAYKEVQKDLMSIDDFFFTSKNGTNKKQQVIDNISALSISLQGQQREFEELLTELEGAKTGVESAAVAANLGKRLNSLRNLSYPSSNTTTPERKKELNSVIRKIQAKINGFVKGGNRGTRKSIK